MGFSLSEPQRERYLAFWDRGLSCSPCVGFRVTESGITPPVPNSASTCPWLIRPGSLDEWYEAKYVESARIVQDTVWTAAPPAQIRWTDGMTDGCLVRGTTSFEPDSEWYGAYSGILSHLTDRANERYPVGNVSLHGITDVLQRTLGSTGLRQLLERDPERFTALASRSGSCLDHAWSALESCVPEVDGGSFIAPLDLWAPGRAFRYQELHADLLSAREYQDHVLPSVARLLRGFARTIFFVPFTGFHILDQVLKLPEVGAIEVYIEPDAPVFSDLIPVLRTIQEHGKSLIVRGMVTQEDFECAGGELSWRGVYLLLTKETLGEALFWASYLVQHSTFREVGL